MRILKLGFISFVFFFGLLFLMSLLVPSRVRISKAINLAPTDSTALQLVRNADLWQRWHPAFATQPASKKMLTKVADTDTLVVYDISGRGPHPVRNSWEVHRFGSRDSLTLQWYMDFRLSYLPWHKFSSLFYEGTYGKMMELGLNNIKRESGATQP